MASTLRNALGLLAGMRGYAARLAQELLVVYGITGGESVRAQRQTATGAILVVQEQRFHLLTERGQGLLLTLAPGAPVQMDDLRRWQAAQTPVTVAYTGEPNLTSGIAYQVQPLAEG
jgi:hypothetical protein